MLSVAGCSLEYLFSFIDIELDMLRTVQDGAREGNT